MPEKIPYQPTSETSNKETWLKELNSKKIRDLVLRYIFGQKMRISHEEAEDIAQNTILKATKAIQKGKFNQSLSKLTTWLLVIAKNTALDLLRRKKFTDLMTPLSDAYPVASEEPTAIENLTMAEKDKGLTLHLGELTPERREIIKLLNQGLTLKQIAEQTKINLNTVKSRLRYAQKHLRELMNGGDKK